MKNDLLADYFLNEYMPMHPSFTKEDLMREFITKADQLNLNQASNELLFEAFTHKSFAHEQKMELKNNERLEFLGDSVLQLVVSEKLLLDNPETKEGKLSKLRSSIVNEKSLSTLARHCKLNQLLILGRGELREKGHEKDSLLANCFESYLGAVYLTHGLDRSKEVCLEIFDSYAEHKSDLFKLSAVNDFDAKSRLQEKTMKLYKEHPKYVSTEFERDKERLFHIELHLKDKKLGELEHRSKKKGMQELAKIVLKEINTNNPGAK